MLFRAIRQLLADDHASGPVLYVAAGGNPLGAMVSGDRPVCLFPRRSMLRSAVAKSGLKPDLPFLLGDPRDPPFANGVFAMIIAGNGLHLSEGGAEPVIDALRLCLAPGGRLALAVPVSQGLLGRLGQVLRFLKPFVPKAMPPEEPTRLFLSCGLRFVAQVKARPTLFPWIITIGQARPRPWLESR